MKKTHILGLVLIACAIGSLVSIAGDASTYTDFQTAINQSNRTHQIVGHLSLDKEILYDPKVDPNSFSFFMKDEKGKEHKVICLQEKPTDFERSEQIVLTGQIRDKSFYAHDIQLKCPSKYQDESIQNASM